MSETPSRTEPVAVAPVLGRYEILQRLAVGGMAEIYLARAIGIENFEKHVVLKRILPQYAENERFVSMFIDEARLAAMLHHPNIAQVYDIGHADGAYFFTMEYVHGDDTRLLLKTLKRRDEQLPVEHALTIAAGAAAGLHHAHERRDNSGRPLNIVHRDVSPSNICITYDGCVKVLDFGIAKAAHRRTATQVGTLKGKISYMSPEQVLAQEVDRRSDIFALGIVLWELLTISRLYWGESEFNIMSQIIDEEPPAPSKIRRDLPTQLDELVLRCLAKDPADRFQTAQDLLRTIEDVASTVGAQLSPTRLADYINETLGQRPEPWLAGQDRPEVVATQRTASRVPMPGARSALEAAKMASAALARERILSTQDGLDDWPAVQFDADSSSLDLDAPTADNDVELISDLVPASGDDDGRQQAMTVKLRNKSTLPIQAMPIAASARQAPRPRAVTVEEKAFERERTSLLYFGLVVAIAVVVLAIIRVASTRDDDSSEGPDPAAVESAAETVPADQAPAAVLSPALSVESDPEPAVQPTPTQPDNDNAETAAGQGTTEGNAGEGDAAEVDGTDTDGAQTTGDKQEGGDSSADEPSPAATPRSSTAATSDQATDTGRKPKGASRSERRSTSKSKSGRSEPKWDPSSFDPPGS